MRRPLRRWLAGCFAAVLLVSAAAACLWSWYDVRKSTLEERRERAIDCALLTGQALKEAGFSGAGMGFGASYAFDRDTMRRLCMTFEMDYLYVYTVAEDRQSITYLVCVASEEAADAQVQELRSPGTVVDHVLGPDENRILDGALEAALLQTEGHERTGNREFTWIVPYRNPAGEIVAMIGADFGIQVTHRLLLRRTLRLLIPILLSMLLAFGGLMLLLQRQVVHPIRTLSRRMNSFVVEREKPLEPLELRSVGEIVEISNAFEKMRGDINDYLARIGTLTKQQLEAEVEMEVARKIQMGLVPERTALQGPGWDLAALSRPTRMVGGDFYDAFPCGEKICVLVGDVSGKGVSAALFMSTAKTLLREKLSSGLGPAEALNAASDALCAVNPEGLFATVFAASLDPATGELRYANAGHTRPLRFGPGSALLAPDPGIALGLFENAGIAEERLTLAPGAGVLLYTDGLTEARSPTEGFFAEARLLEIAGALPPAGSAARVLETVVSAVDAFCAGGEQFDDMAVLVLAFRGPEPAWETLPVALSAFETMKVRVFALLGETPAARSVLLACDELLANVVSHSGADRLRFRCLAEGETLRVDLADNGRAFDPTQPPQLPEDPDELSEGGMGLTLVHRLAASMEYHRRGRENCLTLWFPLEERQA